MRRLGQCPICNSNRITRHYGYRAESGSLWTVCYCTDCTHGFLDPQPTWDELKPYYAWDYAAYGTAHGAEGPDDDVIRIAKAQGEFRHVRVFKGARLLDVGCGGGYFLRIASEMGAVVQGIEPVAVGAGAARGYGLPVYEGTLKEYVRDTNGKEFDIISACHVLEHSPDPVLDVTAMRQLLAPGGRIYLIVPNAGCWAARSLKGRWHSADLPRHLMQFTRTSLFECASRAGLRVHMFGTSTLPRACAASIRLWLRYRWFLPRRMTVRLGVIDNLLARQLARRLDAKQRGEALIGTFAH